MKKFFKSVRCLLAKICVTGFAFVLLAFISLWRKDFDKVYFEMALAIFFAIRHHTDKVQDFRLAFHESKALETRMNEAIYNVHKSQLANIHKELKEFRQQEEPI